MATKLPNANPNLTSSAAHTITVKLTSTNYILWKTQVIPFLKGNQLFSFIDGSAPRPSPTINDEPNPEYDKWVLQDQLLFSALSATLTDDILAQVVDCSTSHEVWTTLHANTTTYAPSSSNPNCWFPDTAATNHFTSNFSTLNLDSHPYQGTDQVCIGDGSSLPIQHSGTGILPTPSGNYLLRHLFYVPAISRNLLSVRQFCCDNNVYFQFNSTGFVVNDMRTQTVFLRGLVKDGLYVLPTDAHAVASIPKQAHIGERTSS
ncbi:hypothetical protein F0562_018415 [Nyssa sinensis]|uniref:Retrovirus-related Pol polyprotein from transposon TNT 1-94-like beta-barrel domain-containing protein n=1 Tax=Nyssa sinensis TaxID=561372 RepID=A0A5J4Z9W4_9ASTE|nr:hypothetical protein F0562_018415 [Nyssa sinensis]